MSTIYDLKIKTRKDGEKSMSEYKGKVLLIVNTATGCGFTPQYEGLEAMYEKYHKDGLEILDFPCDQFGHQAPGDDEEIHTFCTGKYKTQFDQFAKIEVNGENAEPIFKFLKDAQKDEDVSGLKDKMAMKAISRISSTCKEPGDIKWNFTKFLVNREGKVVKRFAPTTKPADIEKDLKELL
ncbi:MAG: glutathione peroxidase [Candidatus Saccharibacteria bacterium]|nr:glutathione peroxidase [Candidatus Saccharibacteria bacterium]